MAQWVRKCFQVRFEVLERFEVRKYVRARLYVSCSRKNVRFVLVWTQSDILVQSSLELENCTSEQVRCGMNSIDSCLASILRFDSGCGFYLLWPRFRSDRNHLGVVYEEK